MRTDTVTPAVSYGYDRRGRQTSIGYNGTTETLAYNSANELLTDAYSGGTLGGLTLTNGYDRLLRRTNLTLKSASAVLASTAYGYDTGSRLASVSGGTYGAAYSYLANSPLVGQIYFTNSGVRRMTTSKQYDFLNRLTSIASVNNQASAVSSFAYAYNSANERIRSTLSDGSYWLYQYDSLGQVTSGKRYWSDQTPVAGQQFGYVFDDIGNRTSTQAGGDSSGANLRPANYSANNLNQYTSRDVPGAVDVLGVAFSTNTVTVNGLAPYRKGEYFREQLGVNNGSAAVWTNITVTSPGQATVSGYAFVPKTQEQFSYDADGNLTQDGHWNYGWDAENRLVGMTNRAAAAPAQVLRFEYDPQSRRIHKRVWSNATGSGTPATDLKFAYDGWNLLVTLNSSLNREVSFLWGLDLSGSLQGAGGVGGLLAVDDSVNGLSFVTFDGNGKVAALVKAADGTTSAKYEYGPFGEVLRATGPMAKANPFRFSTKYQDDETDLLYYGYRYYNASTGKWLSRDPIEERGGLNIYAFCVDDALNRVDGCGLEGNPISSTIPGLTGSWNPDAYGSGGSLYGPGYLYKPPTPPTPSTPNAYSYGFQWFEGSAQNLTFRDNDTWTMDMKRSIVVEIDRERMREALTAYCKEFLLRTVVVPLGRELGEIPRKDYALGQFPYELYDNPTAAFIGSWTSGNMTATQISCCLRKARVHFHAINITGIASLTHGPPSDGHYAETSGLPNDLFGRPGPMQSVSQTFDWDEDILF